MNKLLPHSFYLQNIALKCACIKFLLLTILGNFNWEKMAEQAQSRVQNSIKEFVNDVDQTHLRPMERNMHLCAAECCGKNNATIDEVHR